MSIGGINLSGLTGGTSGSASSGSTSSGATGSTSSSTAGSTSSAIDGINFSGLASGLDDNSIIQQLIAVDSVPMKLFQQQQRQLQLRQADINQVSALVTALQASASALDSPNAFSAVTASVTDNTIATVTAQTGAQTGTHTLQVKNLAQAQALGSTASLTSQTNALGASGQIVINGKAINVTATDSLQSIAANINSAQVGVNASIVSTSTNNYTLVLSSANTGTANAISLSDTAGGAILQNTLGLIGSSTAVNHPIANGAASGLFTDSSTSIGTLLGLTAPQSGTIQINGTGVNVDLSTDSLSSIAAKINSAGIAGVTASIVTAKDPVSGANKQQLQITGASGTPAFTDGNSILANLGVLQNTPAHILQPAGDASFSLDGLSITRSSNTVTDVLSGVTINLLKDTNSPTTQFTVAPDTSAITSNVQGFVSAYNQLVSTVGNLASFDPQTDNAGPLFGNYAVQNLMESAASIVSSAVPGLSGSVSSLAAVGITLDQTGNLNVNSTTLTNAITGNLQGVSRLFKASGVATDSSISFISATEQTKASVNAPYAIHISQVATQASLTAGTQHTADNNPNAEVLTFTGTAFGASGHTITLGANSTLDGLASQINADPILGAVLTASTVNGKLTLTANTYGSNSSFSVSSSQAAAANNSGIGTAAVQANGLDVAGTINGEVATGKGQILTGNAGNATTDGLKIQVTSPLAGDHGTINVTQGMAALFNYFGTDNADPITGALTQYSNDLGTQITDMTTQITQMQTNLNAQQQALQQQFSAMETAVAQLKSASNGLAALGVTPSALG